MANISYRLGEDVSFQSKPSSLGDNREVAAAFQTIRENLAAVGIKVETEKFRMGRTLQVDAAQERFVGEGAEQANPFLTRKYRAPFVVPESV